MQAIPCSKGRQAPDWQRAPLRGRRLRRLGPSGWLSDYLRI